MDKKILIILGPTTTGKTDMAITLARKFNGELISADSRQVYINLDIGTGKIPNHYLQFKKRKGYWEIDGIKIWLYDVASPKRQYNVSHFTKDATKLIRDIQGRGKLPILTGGTGFYIRALLNGLSSLTIPISKRLRRKLEVYSLSQLQEMLKKNAPEVWKRMNNSDKQNPRRLIRSIEIKQMSPRKSLKNQVGIGVQADMLKIGLTASRKILYKKSDRRVINRMNQGMLEEARMFYRNDLTLKRMKQLGLEYGILADYIDGKIKNKQELIKILQDKIHGYIRRQLTWFRKEQNVHWFDISKKNLQSQVEKLIGGWYDSKHA